MFKITWFQFSSVAQLCPTLCDPMNCSMPASLSITNSRSPPKLMSIESLMPSNYLIFCHSLLLLLSIFPGIRVFSKISSSHQVTKTGVSASASELTMNTQDWSPLEDWLDLLAVQGTLKSLLQHHSSKASILQCSSFFIVQLSHLYMTTGKAKALTR